MATICEWLRRISCVHGILVFCLALAVPSVGRAQQNAVDQSPNKVLPTQSPPKAEDGHEMSWEGWTFRWSFRDIEGLVLSDVKFQKRQVLKYLGLAEIYVPYATGTPRPEDFALGGFKANPFPIQVGLDCYARGTVCQSFNADGSLAGEETAAVMIHEEDTGFMYAGRAGRAPGKMLVLWSMAHFPGPPGDEVNRDGYTYVIRWNFHNDGRIGVQIGSTGGLQHLNNSEDRARGLVVGLDQSGEQVFAPSHVHNFISELILISMALRTEWKSSTMSWTLKGL